MAHLALYRKYRPKTFDEVIGQDHITNTLINQIKNDQVGHAYLFCGSRGTGKTSTAKIFARAINCESPVNGSPCGKCNNCKSNMEQNMDILEIDAASNNSVDEIRNLREQIKYPPVVGKYKVYIVDEVHMLSISAFNALLKTLEEPPAYVVFILATTEVHKLPATILSRCMRFDFKLVSVERLSALIKSILDENKIKYEDKAINLLARSGEGSVRDALSITDRVISFAENNITYDKVLQIVGSVEKEDLVNLVDSFIGGDIGMALKNLDEMLAGGKSPLVLSKDIISYLRDVLVVMTLGEKGREMVVAPDNVYAKMQEQADHKNYQKVINFIDRLSEVEQELRFSVKPKIVLETSVIKAMNYISLEERIEKIELKLQGENFEVKKKITPKSPSGDLAFGRLLVSAHSSGKMMLYTALTKVTNASLAGAVLTLKVDNEQLFESLNQNKVEMDELAKQLGLSVVIAKEQSNTEDVKNLLVKILGEKLEIIND